MNFRDLVTRLDLIEDAGLTLATVQAAENLARDKATAEKTKGGWTGFTSWDPKTAGNIAVAKLAQANRLDGLFNSDGDFIVAYGNNEWSSKEGQAPRTTPPTPEDWKPLATLGLIPDNAKGPAGLTDWLTGGKSKEEFNAVKQQSAGVRQAAMQNAGLPAAVTSPVVAPPNLKSTPLPAAGSNVSDNKSLDPGEVIVPKSGNTEPSEKAKEVDDLLNQFLSMNDNDSEEDQVITEGMYKSLVESFGYSANEGWKGDLVKGTAVGGGIGLGLGVAGGALGAKDGTNSEKGLLGIKWDEDVVPGIPYSLSDLVLDLGITTVAMTVGALGGPPGEMAAVAANASRIKKIITVLRAAGKIIMKTIIDPREWGPRLQQYVIGVAKSWPVIPGTVAANVGMKGGREAHGAVTAVTNNKKFDNSQPGMD